MGKAAADKKRYEKEMKAYKPPYKPKRLMVAFMFFSIEQRPSVQKKNPSLGIADISKVLGQQWRRAEGQVRREGGRGQEALREGDEGVQAALQAQAPDGGLHVLLDRAAPERAEEEPVARDRGHLQGPGPAVARHDRRPEGQVRGEGGQRQDPLREGDGQL